MRRFFSFLFLMVFVLPLSVQSAQTFRIDLPDGQKLKVQTPDDWRKNEDKTPFDLQLLSGNERTNSGIFYYYKSDLAESLTPTAVLHKQIEDIESKRKNFRAVGEPRRETHGDKNVTYALYQGEKGDSRYYYYFTLVESSSHPDLFLVVLEIAVPSDWKNSQATLDAISASARVVKE